MKSGKIIDWFSNWCPRETLLRSPSQRRMSLDIVFLRNLLREHPLGVVLTILTLTAGLGEIRLKFYFIRIC